MKYLATSLPATVNFTLMIPDLTFPLQVKNTRTRVAGSCHVTY